MRHPFTLCFTLFVLFLLPSCRGSDYGHMEPLLANTEWRVCGFGLVDDTPTLLAASKGSLEFDVYQLRDDVMTKTAPLGVKCPQIGAVAFVESLASPSGNWMVFPSLNVLIGSDGTATTFDPEYVIEVKAVFDSGELLGRNSGQDRLPGCSRRPLGGVWQHIPGTEDFEGFGLCEGSAIPTNTGEFVTIDQREAFETATRRDMIAVRLNDGKVRTLEPASADGAIELTPHFMADGLLFFGQAQLEKGGSARSPSVIGREVYALDLTTGDRELRFTIPVHRLSDGAGIAPRAFDHSSGGLYFTANITNDYIAEETAAGVTGVEWQDELAESRCAGGANGPNCIYRADRGSDTLRFISRNPNKGFINNIYLHGARDGEMYAFVVSMGMAYRFVEGGELDE